MDGSCFPGDLDQQDLLSNYLRPPESAARQGACNSSTPLAQKCLISLWLDVATLLWKIRCLKETGQQLRTWRKQHGHLGFNSGTIVKLRQQVNLKNVLNKVLKLLLCWGQVVEGLFLLSRVIDWASNKNWQTRVTSCQLINPCSSQRTWLLACCTQSDNAVTKRAAGLEIRH